MCNEHFDRPFVETCHLLADLGFDGVEVTPWTVTDDPDPDPGAVTARVRAAADATGLDVVGVPRVFAAGESYHVAGDLAVRERTVDALRATVEFCAAIGGSVVIFGSPDQRNLPADLSGEEAWDRAVRTFQDESLLAALEDGGVTLCMEPLSPPHTDFVTSASQAVEFVTAVDHPNVGVALDGYHLAAEADSPATAVREAGSHLAHFHADNTEGLGPGRGDVDYADVATALDDVGYDGYCSLEVHADISGGPDESLPLDPVDVARETIEFLERVLDR